MLSKYLGSGALADVAFHQGRWWCVWHGGAHLHLVSLEPGTLTEQSWTSWTIGEPGAFPRLLSWVGRLWLAYREGAAPYRIVLREVGTSHVEHLDIGHGSDPVALGAGDVAWQATGAPEWQVWRKPLVGTELSRFVRQGRPTGLSRVLADGAVKVVDEDREELTGYTRPCWAGDLVVAEGRNLGAYARLTDGRELIVWPGQEAVTPRCATNGGDLFGIVTWGREGVRFAEVMRTEFAHPTNEPDEPVLDTTSTVDVLDYLPMGLTLDGDHLLAFHKTGQQPNVFSIAKHADGGGEWWAYDDHWLYHHLDQAGSSIEEVASGRFIPRYAPDGSRKDAYYLADDARILPRLVKTGDVLTAVGRIYRLADGHSDPWRHVNTVELFSSFPMPMGSGRALRWTYDNRTGRDDNGRLKGRFEKFTFVIINGRRYARWEDWRTKDDNSGDELMQQTQFQQVDTAPVVSWRLSLRPREASLLPTSGVDKVGVTFERPSFPLDVKVGDQTQFVLKRDGDWPSRVRWWRRDPAGVVESTDWRDPSQDADHTWAWERATTWEVGIEWTGGGTGTRRVVQVASAGSGPNPGAISVGLDEMRDLHTRLESSYQIDQASHPEITTRVDEEGRPFWTHQYLLGRGAGANHEAVVRSIENDIDRFEGRQPRWETRPVDPGPGPGPLPPSDLDRIDGQLQLEAGGGFHVGGRAVLPTLCHYGDALSKWMRDRGHVLRNLDLIAGAGYHGIRYWTALDGDWWNGRHVGENFQQDYWDQHRAFLLELKARGLVAQISQGSLTRDAVPDRDGFANRMADLLTDVGTDVCALFEGVNEARDTGEPDAGRLAAFVRVFKSRLPHVLCALSAYTGTEDVVILNEFSRDPADLFVVHPYRGGHNHDKTRHLMSLRYEGRPAKRLGWNGEGPGPGNRVSAIDNRDAMTADTMCGLAAMSFMMRMAYVYFCGVGVISDDGGSQTFDQMPGFFEVPKVRALVPADVCRYSGPIFHGGDTWRNDRTFAARGDVRADHVVHHDGRRVIGIYGPGDLNVPQERGFSADVDHRFGNEFRLVVGRAA
jgi:hypothetical protein